MEGLTGVTHLTDIVLLGEYVLDQARTGAPRGMRCFAGPSRWPPRTLIGHPAWQTRTFPQVGRGTYVSAQSRPTSGHSRCRGGNFRTPCAWGPMFPERGYGTVVGALSPAPTTRAGVNHGATIIWHTARMPEQY